MSRKLYPIGIQTFERIRKEDMLYVDKTEYVYHMTHTDGKYFFLSRPRRFGKSLLVSTLHSYFEGKRELFNGLAIERLEKEWTEYPVLHFDMSGGKHMEKDQLDRYLDRILTEQEETWGIVKPAVDANDRLDALIKAAYSRTGRQVVVLIDEYDAPLLDVVHEDVKLPLLRNVMRNFYSPLKKNDPYLRFVFLTGITKFSQLSIFSELNNIVNISMNENYAGICGITEDELTTQMDSDISSLADRCGISETQALARLKEHYDGYHFTWPSPDVFNPFSLLNCLAEGKFNSYWFGSGTPTYLINMMRKFNVLPSQLGRTRVKLSSFDAATETMPSLTPLLYQSGYLTIKGYEDETDVYTLDFPNKEIVVGLFDSLLPGYLDNAIDSGRVAIADVSVLLKHGRLNEALTLLRDFLASVPYCDNTNYEGHYQQVFFIIFALLTNYNIIVEQRTARGRIDVVLETADTVYIFELKFGEDANLALAQINARHYADAYAIRDKRIVKAGLCFYPRNNSSILDWVIE